MSTVHKNTEKIDIPPIKVPSIRIALVANKLVLRYCSLELHPSRKTIRHLIHDVNNSRLLNEQLFIPNKGLIDSESCGEAELAEFIQHAVATLCGRLVTVEFVTATVKVPPDAKAPRPKR